MNLRDRRLMDVHEVNLETGAVKLVAENPGDVVGWDSTDDLEVRVAQARSRTAAPRSASARARPPPGRRSLTAPFGESVDALDITADGAAVLLTSSLNANTNRVIRKEIATGTETVIAENPNVDAGDGHDPPDEARRAGGRLPGRPPGLDGDRPAREGATSRASGSCATATSTS